jgi:hypothetical protein
MSRVENIDPDLHPHWISTLRDQDRVEVFINAKPKDAAATDHKQLFGHIIANDQNLAIYTDGSGLDKRAGAGVIMLHQTGLQDGPHDSLGTSMEVFFVWRRDLKDYACNKNSETGLYMTIPIFDISTYFLITKVGFRE